MTEYLLLFLFGMIAFDASCLATMGHLPSDTNSPTTGYGGIQECCRQLSLQYYSYYNRNNISQSDRGDAVRVYNETFCVNRLSGFCNQNGRRCDSVFTDSVLQVCIECYGKTVYPDDIIWLTNFTYEQRAKLLQALQIGDTAHVTAWNRNITYIINLPVLQNYNEKIEWWKFSLSNMTAQNIYELMYCPNVFQYQAICRNNYGTYNLHQNACDAQFIHWVVKPFCDAYLNKLTMYILNSYDFMGLLRSTLSRQFRLIPRRCAVYKVIAAGLQAGLRINQIGLILLNVDDDKMLSIDDYSILTYPMSSMYSVTANFKYGWELVDSMTAAKRACNYTSNETNWEATCLTRWTEITNYTQKLKLNKDLLIPYFASYDGDCVPKLNQLVNVFTSVRMRDQLGPNGDQNQCMLSSQKVVQFFIIGYWDFQKDDSDIKSKLDSILERYKLPENECDKKRKNLETELDKYIKGCKEMKYYTDGDCKSKANQMWNNVIGN